MKIFILLSLLLSVSTPASELYFEKDSALPLVYVTVAFRGGSTQDPDGKNGLTDIMAKAMLRGTKSKTKQQIDASLDSLGANLGVETRAEFVAFRATVLSENIKPFLQLLSEIIDTPSFRAQDLEKLKKEQMSQLMDELSQDRGLVRMRFDQVYFKGHPYSKLNNGRVKDIQTITGVDIQKQYQKLINQNQMVVLGGGDTQESELKSFVQGIEKSRNGSSTLTSVPEFKNEPKKLKVVIFDKPDRTQTQIVIAQNGVSIKDPRVDALQLMNFAFGGGSFQSRLMIELRIKTGWTYTPGSGMKLASHPHTWRIAYFPKNSDTPPSLKFAIQMIRDLKEKGLTQEEFDFSKRSMINSSGFGYNTPQKRLENKLLEVLYGLPEGYMKNFASRLEKLTLPEVNQIIHDFVQPDHFMIGLVATASISKVEIATALGIPENEIEVQDFQKE